MYINNIFENFSAFYCGDKNANIQMSAACGNGGGGGCYNCKCAPKRK